MNAPKALLVWVLFIFVAIGAVYWFVPPEHQNNLVMCSTYYAENEDDKYLDDEVTVRVGNSVFRIPRNRIVRISASGVETENQKCSVSLRIFLPEFSGRTRDNEQCYSAPAQCPDAVTIHINSHKAVQHAFGVERVKANYEVIDDLSIPESGVTAYTFNGKPYYFVLNAEDISERLFRCASISDRKPQFVTCQNAIGEPIKGGGSYYYDFHLSRLKNWESDLTAIDQYISSLRKREVVQ